VVAGGSVTSADGKLTLEVPAGALSSDVTFTITSATTPATGDGMGTTATTFQVDATIGFYYEADVVDISGQLIDAIERCYPAPTA